MTKAKSVEERAREEEEKLSLVVFSPPKQAAILGHLMLDPGFFQQAVAQGVKGSWWVDEASGWAWDKAVEVYKRTGAMPSALEILEEFHHDKEKEERVSKSLVSAHATADSFDLGQLKKDLTKWMQGSIFKEGVLKAGKKYNAAFHITDNSKKDQVIGQAFTIMSDTVKRVTKANFEADRRVIFENPAADIKKINEEQKNSLSFGSSIFDRQLVPWKDGGSLLLGDATVLLAAQGTGKTTTAITVAMHQVKGVLRSGNTKDSRHVLFIPHEGNIFDLKEKVWCNFLQIDRQTLHSRYEDPHESEKIYNQIKFLQRYFTMVDMIGPDYTVEQVVALIRNENEKHRALYGRGYDLVIDDYPANLNCENISRQEKRYNVEAKIYNTLYHLAAEEHFHLLVPIQANREGARVARRENGEDRFLVPTAVKECWGAMCDATNIISLNRNPADMAEDRVTYFICKSRSSKTEIAVVCQSNFSLYTTHSDDLKNGYGCTFYSGSCSKPDKIKQLLAQYKGDPNGIPAAGALVEEGAQTL